ncbi:hypothetical protein RhiirA1_401973 [Rhizophagus irregularis]|uniref:Uncharacterized protein n=1 Tax=Rhizophagus irregularis TaxID=588596 RepID=A0A2N0R027_9GLOM|nr:hypothetical protein RhiirA1_401973 [Rhizophagus irregularis]
MRPKLKKSFGNMYSSTILLCWYKLDGTTKRNSSLSSEVSSINICFWDLVEPEAADSCCFVAYFWVLVEPKAADSCCFITCFWVLIEPEAADSCCFVTYFWVLVKPEAADSCCFNICFWFW